MSSTTVSRGARPAPRRRGIGVGSMAAALPMFLVLAVPVGMVVGHTAPGAVLAELREPETRSAIALSLMTSTVALAVAVLLGTPLAYWLARSRSRAAAIAETIVDLPIVVPPSVAGVALLLTLGRSGPIGAWLDSMGLSVPFTTGAVVIAQVFVAAPYYVRSARAGLASVSADLLEAARIDGASPWQVARRVVMPVAARSMGAGAAMCWSRAIGEFGATIIFAGNLPGVTQTMPLAVYMGFEHGLDRALVLSTVLIGISVAVLLAVRVLGWHAPDRA